MARGKIRIKRIETNRQIIYAKRCNELYKMTADLDALCCDDHKISVIMISSNGMLHEYISPSTTTKEVIDLYQTTQGIDLWSPHYERMKEKLKELKETNQSLRKQVSQMKGECLSDLSFVELHTLDQEMQASLEVLRRRKDLVIKILLEVFRKKIKRLKVINEGLLTDFRAADEPDHGGVDNGDVDGDGISQAFASGLQLNEQTDTENKPVLTSRL